MEYGLDENLKTRNRSNYFVAVLSRSESVRCCWGFAFTPLDYFHALCEGARNIFQKAIEDGSPFFAAR
ncbi:hypothetical protein M513_10348 [Trichuris suis]|uniref:Uncharacterized protein n=1 Tax=Trichuris suis TaxID=68888 RepID=A0A085LUZ7_9BILA|nr:hypothetical protein M513_10348 [Trichuris suis]